MPSIEDKLLDFQKPHLYQLFNALLDKNCILDASDTGTGKTYISLVLSSLMNLKPFVICPKSVLSNWAAVSKELQVDLFGISNYESLKSGNYYVGMEKVKCPYLDIIEDQTESSEDENDAINEDELKDIKVRKVMHQKKKTYKFIFQLPKDVIVIFDEAHRCRNYKSVTSCLLRSITDNKKLLLSATITDKIASFKPFGICFELYKTKEEFKIWMNRQLMSKKRILKSPDKNENMLSVINMTLFPNRGSRLQIANLGNVFPKNTVTTDLYYCENNDKIQKEYDIIKAIFEEYKSQIKKTAFPLAKIIYSRMKIEQFKIPIFLNLTKDAIKNGYSVVIFTCFADTMFNLAHELQTDCLIYGDQSIEERESCIRDFQSNKCKIIICMIQAGSVGISLHDLHGGHPRMSLINPSWNGIEMKQALGRIYRAGAKTPTEQKLIYCGNTYEEQICKLINKKINVIDQLNNGMIMDEIEIRMMEEIDDGNFKIAFDTSNIDDKDKGKQEFKKHIYEGLQSKAL